MMISLAHAASVLCPPLDDGRHFVQGDLGAGTRWGQRGRGKKRCSLLRLYGFIRGRRRVEARGARSAEEMRAWCRVEKLQEWNSHVPDSVGSRKMQNLRWDFVQNVIIRPRKTLAPAKGGAGGVGMTPPNWNRQLWRHQCRSHSPANPDGPVRGLRRLTASGGELVFWDLACHSTAFKQLQQDPNSPRSPNSKTLQSPNNRHARRCVATLPSLHRCCTNICNLSTANGR